MPYSKAFEEAVNHAMLYEVGGFWKLSADVEAGKIDTPAQRKSVGYVNDPDDAGGETKFGVAKNANPTLNIKTLTWAQAKDVYYQKYWLLGQCDKLPPRVAILHFDGCVNHGVGRANKFLQMAVGVSPDGIVGPATVGKTKLLDEIKVCNLICNQRETFYRQIVAAKPTQQKFLNGWLRRIIEMRVFTTSPTLKT
jgi:lysozyme family protein